ncbi:SDR family oxidoreductase [Pseudomonas sp. WHRI 8519]|uniref:SDR family NAD(P)-dependent oxidoreductase n=1 Tax=Pseudomonas sp. WHRI 8519 TaxID=3162567 RepID=UPI0032EBA2BE
MSKVVIVSGGTFGLGHGVAMGLARSGYRVLAFGIGQKQAGSIATNTIEAMNQEARTEELPLIALEADVTLEADVDRVIKATLEAYGRIDAVVNNAAIGPLGTVLNTAPELWDKIFAVNLRGPFLMARAAIPHMQNQGGGSIVNVGSGAGWGKPNMAAYSASKGGLVALNAALALDHFSQKIRVNMVIPGGGGIDAGMTRGRLEEAGAAFPTNFVGSVAGRAITGEDMMAAIRFLISDDAQAISGTIIDVGCFAHQGSSIPLGKHS